jgi:WD40 repeat protein
LHGGAPRRLVPGGGRMISRLALSSDGQVLIERASSPPQLVPVAGGEVMVLGPRTGLRFAVASGDWSRMVMMTAANEVAVARAGEPPRVLAHTDRAIAFLAISPRGDTVVIHDGRTIWALPFAGGPLRELVRYADQVKAVTWSSDGRTIAIGGVLPEIFVVDAATGAVTELLPHTNEIYTLAFSRDGTRLLSASDDSTARVWNLTDHTQVVLRGHDDDVYRARFSADERSVATSSLDGSARVWAIDPPSAAAYPEGDPIESMQAEGGRVLVRTATGTARWDLASGRREPLLSWGNETHRLGSGFSSDDGEHVVIPNADGSMELRARTGPAIALGGHRGLITHVEFSRDGRTVFSSSSDGTLRRWDVATGAGSIVLEGTTPVRGFSVARDGRIAAQAGDLAYLIDPAGRVTRLGQGGAWCIGFAEFEPIADRLIAHRCDNSLAIIAGDRVIELSTGGSWATRIAVSPDGRRIAAGLNDRTIRVWSAETGQVVEVLRGHSDLVFDVAFSPDGRRLASASYDKTIRLWDLTTERHRVLRGHTAPVNRVAWRGGRQLVTSSLDGTIRLWEVPSLELPSAADIARRLDAATTAQIALDRPATAMPQARGT